MLLQKYERNDEFWSVFGVYTHPRDDCGNIVPNGFGIEAYVYALTDDGRAPVCERKPDRHLTYLTEDDRVVRVAR